MVITEVRIKLVEENNERLMAFCSITLDNAFVIRDLKIIEGTRGLFVAMPSRKLTDRCPRCGSKNHLRSRFCNNCGSHLDESRAPRDHDGRAKLHADIAHPINSMCREIMQQAIVKSFHDEKDRAKLPGYVCRYDDFDGGDFDYDTPATTSAAAPAVAADDASRTNGYRAHAGHGPASQARATHLRVERSTPVRRASDEPV